MNATLKLTPELGNRLRTAARHHGVSADAYTVQLLERHLPCDSNAEDLVALPQSRMDADDDGEQRETGDHLVKALDEDRLTGRQLFPAEQKGITW